MNRPPRNRGGSNQPQNQRQPQQSQRQAYHDEGNSQNQNINFNPLSTEIDSFDGTRGRGRGRRFAGANHFGDGNSRLYQENQQQQNQNYFPRQMPTNYQSAEQNLAIRNRNPFQQDFSRISTFHDGQSSYSNYSNSHRSYSTGSTRSEPMPTVDNQTSRLATGPGVYHDPAVLLAAQMQSQLSIGLGSISSNQSNAMSNPFLLQTQMNVPTGGIPGEATMATPSLVNTYGSTMPGAVTGQSHGGSYYVPTNQRAFQAIPQAPMAQNYGNSSIYGHAGMSANLVQPSGSYFPGVIFTGNTGFNAVPSFVNLGGQQAPQPTRIIPPTFFCANCGRALVQCADAATQSVQDSPVE